MPDTHGPAHPARVAVFGMPEEGHFQRLRPVIAGLARRGFEVHVFTDRRFARAVDAAGATFVDLFGRYLLDEADDESVPVPARFVTFAARYAEPLRRELERLRPSVVVYDTFAVVGRVLGHSLGIPYVNVCAGHNMHPNGVDRLVSNHPRIAISERCHDAVGVLRERWGLDDASPYSYLTGLSPHLNIICEPREFLTEGEREPFEPVAFFGSLPGRDELAQMDSEDTDARIDADGAAIRAYICFGTVVWRYWPDEAIAALRTIAAAFGDLPDAHAVISLGGRDPGPPVRDSLERPNVTVHERVAQWGVLRDATAFITHHGLNSTHEAIYNRVPMVSHPFFSDQPALARRCQELGLAVPFVEWLREPPTTEDVHEALRALDDRRDMMLERLDEAREWELQAIDERGSVLDRVAELAAA